MLAFYLSVVPMSEEESDVFIKIYETYLPLMSKIACKYLTSPQDREDAVQNAMLAIARNIGKLQTPTSDEVKMYVAKTIKTAAIEILRENSHHAYVELANDIRDDSQNIEQAIMDDDFYGRLVAFIKTLPQQYIDPLTLFVVLELNPQEIATTLGRSVHTVRTQLRRGRRLLQKKWSEVNEL